MAYLLLAECRVTSGRMQEFTAQIQQWEQDALQHPNAPWRHAVYLASDDPANVLVITEFESRDAATRFAADGLMAAFREAVLPCVEAMPAERDGYDLFYSATPDGPSVTFGQAT